MNADIYTDTTQCPICEQPEALELRAWFEDGSWQTEISAPRCGCVLSPEIEAELSLTVADDAAWARYRELEAQRDEEIERRMEVW